MALITRLAGLFGTLTQGNIDTKAQVTRSLGNRPDLFEGYRPIYIELNLNPALVRAWGALGRVSIDYSILGQLTGIGFSWLQTVMPTTEGLICQRTWYATPGQQPISYDTEALFTLDTVNTGAANVGTYKFFYEIVQGTELEAAQAIMQWA